MANSYFSHDADAHDDPKLKKVLMRYGVEGYGIYWLLLEAMRQEDDYSLPSDYSELIAYEYRIDEQKIKSIISEFNLFEFTEDGSKFYSPSFIKRMAYVDEKTKKLSEAGKRGAAKRWAKKENSHPITCPIATPLGSDIALNGNKIKLNKIKSNNNFISEKMTDTVNPTPVQFETPEEAGVQPSQEMIQKRQFFTLNIWSKYPETRRGDFEEAFTQFLSALEEDKAKVIADDLAKYVEAKQNEPIKYTAMLANNLKRKDYRNDYSAKKQGRKEELPQWANQEYKPKKLSAAEEERLRKENEDLMKQLGV